MAMVRAMRGGKANDPAFGTRMKGVGAYAGQLARRFELACRRLGLNKALGAMGGLDTSLFRPPPRILHPRPGNQLRLL